MRLKRRHLDLAEGRAAYLELGLGGTPVVLVHGFAGDLLSWQFTLPALAARRRAIAVDLPGHGHSTMEVGDGRLEPMADWLLRVLDGLRVERAHLVGHSMGGKLAVLTALKAPERVASLSLVACAGISPTYDRALLARMVDSSAAEEVEECVAALFAAPSPLVEPMAKALLARPDKAPLRRIIEGAFAVPGHVSRVEWGRLPCPVRFAWGLADRVVPVPPPGWLPPDADFHALEGVGHLPHIEAASRVNALLTDFLQGR